MKNKSKEIVKESKSFKSSDMKDMGHSSRCPQVDKKWYPSVSFDDLDINENEVGDEVTIHAHAKIKGMNIDDTGKKNVTVEIRKAAIKEGLNPAVSKKQRKMMAIAEHHPEMLYSKNRGVLKMGKQKLHEFAATKEKGLQSKKRKRR